MDHGDDKADQAGVASAIAQGLESSVLVAALIEVLHGKGVLSDDDIRTIGTRADREMSMAVDQLEQDAAGAD
jgi:hypothetical protein